MFKRFIAVLLLPFMISYFLRFLYVLSLVYQYFDVLHAFVIGFFIFTLGYFLVFRRRMSFWLTLEHELTHILFAILMLKPVSGLFVTKYAGGATWLEKKPNFLIRLAPYFFPTFPMVILLLKPIINVTYWVPYQFVLGFFSGYHWFSSLKESHPAQSDLQTDGLLFSYVFIFLMHSIFLSCIIIVLLDDWHVFGMFLKDGFLQTIDFFRSFIQIK